MKTTPDQEDGPVSIIPTSGEAHFNVATYEAASREVVLARGIRADEVRPCGSRLDTDYPERGETSAPL